MSNIEQVLDAAPYIRRNPRNIGANVLDYNNTMRFQTLVTVLHSLSEQYPW